jgi:predicted metal-dependent RNase
LGYVAEEIIVYIFLQDTKENIVYTGDLQFFHT